MIYAKIEILCDDAGHLTFHGYSRDVRKSVLIYSHEEDVRPHWSNREMLIDGMKMTSNIDKLLNVLAENGFTPISETFFYKP